MIRSRRASSRPGPPTSGALPRILSLAVLGAALAAALPEVAAEAQEVPAIPKPATIRIASFDIRAAQGLAPPAPAATPKPAWRTSFGSERVSAPEAASAPSAVKAGPLAADVVLIRGVTTGASLRKLFPANTWKLVVSRQLFTADDAIDSGPGDATSVVPTTAVAVRYAAGWRVVGQEHFIALPADVAGGGEHPAAGTAVRLNIAYGPSLFLVALDLSPGSCAADERGCKRPKSLEAWLQKTLSPETAAVLGGRLSAAGPTALPPPPCVDEGIEAVFAPGGKSVPVDAPAAYSEDAGCLAALTLPVP